MAWQGTAGSLEELRVANSHPENREALVLRPPGAEFCQQSDLGSQFLPRASRKECSLVRP
jgi:hypothetical protein